MGRPLKLAEVVEGTEKVGEIGDTARPGQQIQFNAKFEGFALTTGYALSQKGSKTFRVRGGGANQEVVLTAVAAGSLTDGQCNIVATDSAGGTYFVSKITKHRVTLVPGTGTQFSSGDSVPWVFTGPTLNETVALTSA